MLPPPGELSGTALSALRGECLPLLLGLLAGVVQSAVAAKLGEQRTRLAIASDGIHDTTKLLLANLGCPPHVGPGTANPHDWPAVVYSPYRGQFAAMVRADNLILLSFRNRCAAAATCGWTVLQDSPVTPSPEFAAAARELPTNYLKSLLSRQLHMERKESLYETNVNPLCIKSRNNAPRGRASLARVGLRRAGRLLDGRTHDALCWDVAGKGEA